MIQLPELFTRTISAAERKPFCPSARASAYRAQRWLDAWDSMALWPGDEDEPEPCEPEPVVQPEPEPQPVRPPLQPAALAYLAEHAGATTDMVAAAIGTTRAIATNVLYKLQCQGLVRVERLPGHGNRGGIKARYRLAKW